ncbi:response regulator receiver protein [Streptomyces laurentii]|uniref:Response regulator receiver protein n=1 Tax=Streptomyces laurentii TaxID=39478 RepID=A0A169NQL1_STRLU|nr:response regulator receiver protein [Streptomyces laurentii]
MPELRDAIPDPRGAAADPTDATPGPRREEPGPRREEPGPRRAVIAEDSVLLRMGLVKVVEMAGFEVAAEVGDAQALLAAVEEHRPDLALVDVRMPPGFTDEGVRAALSIRRSRPSTALLLLSQYVEERYAADLLAANTSGVGYLLKQRVADVEEFIEALRRVADGGTALDPQVVAQLLVRRSSDPLDRLTARERDVLALMAEGRSNAGIAAQLVVSESAVAKHINSILSKLDLPRADADHRRVLAVLRFLGVGAQEPGPTVGGGPAQAVDGRRATTRRSSDRVREAAPYAGRC